FTQDLIALDQEDIDEILRRRKAALSYQLSGNELGSQKEASDDKGLVKQVTHEPENPLVDEKKKSPITFETPARLKQVIICYLGAAVFWLVFGTLIGQYLGLKF